MSTKTYLFKKSSLQPLIDTLAKAGTKFLAPVTTPGGVFFAPTTTASAIAFDSLQAGLSAKSVAFPQTEEILNYVFEDKDVKMTDRDPDSYPRLALFGLRPCEAAGFPLLNSIFTWDTEDIFFKSRLERSTIISVACKSADDYCFCTSVASNPGDTRGSDILLTEYAPGLFLAEALTDKAAALVALAPALFEPAPAAVSKSDHIANLPPRFDSTALAAKLPALFERADLWKSQSLRCLGCGACAFTCPACVCFDLQDESTSTAGRRLRCWDSCGFSLFTLHTSGHNPRHVQSERWRQRVMHKFSYYRDRFGAILCTGCGKCSRNCPVDMNLPEHLKSLTEAQ